MSIVEMFILKIILLFLVALLLLFYCNLIFLCCFLIENLLRCLFLICFPMKMHLMYGVKLGEFIFSVLTFNIEAKMYYGSKNMLPLKHIFMFAFIHLIFKIQFWLKIHFFNWKRVLMKILICCNIIKHVF